MSCLQRIHFDYKDISVGTGNLQVLEHAVDELARRYSMEWQVRNMKRCRAGSCGGNKVTALAAHAWQMLSLHLEHGSRAPDLSLCCCASASFADAY
jgi:hypothetical protein